MSEQARTPWWRRRWVSVGEVVAIAALVIAALGYWDAHRDRRAARAEKAVAAQQEARREALVLTASVGDDGARLLLAPLQPGQAVQSQRYAFPTAVLDRPMEVSSAQPQIDRAWFDAGLKHALQTAAEARGDRLAEGEGALPVAIVTSYIEDGEPRTDASLYRIGFRLAPAGLFGGWRLVLQGLSLVRHGLGADPQAAANASWAAGAKHPLARAAD
ncbi:MAG: hypothetical protein INR64_00910 [Caulobacteraceae bacterium]|nr:hypothetical protein [Caulobacter sp.]